MKNASTSRASSVVGPLGATLTLEDLPPSHTTRWISRRKAEVVVAVNGGLLSLEQACKLYRLSDEEFLSWSRSFKDFGLPGLEATRALMNGPTRPMASRRRVNTGAQPLDQSHTGL